MHNVPGLCLILNAGLPPTVVPSPSLSRLRLRAPDSGSSGPGAQFSADLPGSRSDSRG